jgi:hypothetical protein
MAMGADLQADKVMDRRAHYRVQVLRFAFYRWTAEARGECVGLGVLGGLLVAIAALFASVAIKAKSFEARNMPIPPSLSLDRERA